VAFVSCTSPIFSNSSCMVMKMIPGCCDVPLGSSQRMLPRQGLTYARNGMCLAAASRAVRKDGRIVSVEHAVQQGLGGGFVHVALCGCVVEDSVKGERLVLYPLSLGSRGRARETGHRAVFRRVKYPTLLSATKPCDDSRRLRTSTSRPAP
jgi:hypothetical protein